MTRPAIAPWLAAIAIVLAYICMAALDGPTDHSTDVAQAQAIDDAHKAEAARLRFEAAAQAMCGPQAAWRAVDQTSVQCLNKRGRKTIVAQVTP